MNIGYGNAGPNGANPANQPGAVAAAGHYQPQQMDTGGGVADYGMPATPGHHIQQSSQQQQPPPGHMMQPGGGGVPSSPHHHSGPGQQQQQQHHHGQMQLAPPPASMHHQHAGAGAMNMMHHHPQQQQQQPQGMAYAGQSTGAPLHSPGPIMMQHSSPSNVNVISPMPPQQQQQQQQHVIVGHGVQPQQGPHQHQQQQHLGHQMMQMPVHHQQPQQQQFHPGHGGPVPPQQQQQQQIPSSPNLGHGAPIHPSTPNHPMSQPMQHPGAQQQQQQQQSPIPNPSYANASPIMMQSQAPHQQHPPGMGGHMAPQSAHPMGYMNQGGQMHGAGAHHHQQSQQQLGHHGNMPPQQPQQQQQMQHYQQGPPHQQMPGQPVQGMMNHGQSAHHIGHPSQQQPPHVSHQGPVQQQQQPPHHHPVQPGQQYHVQQQQPHPQMHGGHQHGHPHQPGMMPVQQAPMYGPNVMPYPGMNPSQQAAMMPPRAPPSVPPSVDVQPGSLMSSHPQPQQPHMPPSAPIASLHQHPQQMNHPGAPGTPGMGMPHAPPAATLPNTAILFSPLNADEDEIILDYDCRLYGFLKLELSENISKKYFLIKAINCYEKRIKSILHENDQSLMKDAKETAVANETEPKEPDSGAVVLVVEERKQIQLAKLYLYLGHFYLLLYDYQKALNAYQKFATFRIISLQDSTFYYGLGLVYFVFGAYRFAARAFLSAIYKDLHFQRINEIHFRLGLIYKELNATSFSLRHFKLALIDSLSTLSSVTKSDIKFCIANLYEINNHHKEALEKYEDILKPETNNSNAENGLGLNNSNNSNSGADSNAFKAKVHRQIGWLHFYSEQLSKLNAAAAVVDPNLPPNVSNATDLKPPIRQLNAFINAPPPPQDLLALQINRRSLQLAVDHLTKSAQLDPNQNLTWYYLGRAFACKGNSREAFVSYKNSVNNPDANGDTWCSIGVLYYQQKQLMDSLQAFICAIQLDRTHFAAWLNLGILYEQDNQLEEALKCYKNAIRCRTENMRQKRLKSAGFASAAAAKRRRQAAPSVTTEQQVKKEGDDSAIESSPPPPAATTSDKSNESDADDEFDELDEAFSDETGSEESDENGRMQVTDDDKTNREELRFLKERTELINTYFELANAKVKEDIKKTLPPRTLPVLSEAFSLQIPTELRQKIVNNNNMQTHGPSAVGINGLSMANVGPSLGPKTAAAATGPQDAAAPKMMMMGPQGPMNPQMAAAMMAAKANKAAVKMPKKPADMVVLKPQQIQLMQQLEANRHQLNPDELQQLNSLKSQYMMMQQQQQQLLQQQQQQQQAMGTGAAFGPNGHPQGLRTGATHGLSGDLLPKDLENVQPITMMQEDADNIMLQDADFNMLLSRQDIAEDLRISDVDKGSLDHVLTTASGQTAAASGGRPLANLSSNRVQPETPSSQPTRPSPPSFPLEQIKLDPQLINGSNTITSIRTTPQTDGVAKTDEQLLAAKLNIRMSADEIIEQCKAFGLNGIQNNSLLKPGRLRKRKPNEFEDEQKFLESVKALNLARLKGLDPAVKVEDDELFFSTSEDEDQENEQSGKSAATNRYKPDDSLPRGALGVDETLRKELAASEGGGFVLNPPAPSVVLETKKDAMSPYLQYFCLSHPLSVVRGLSHVLRLDLGLFSTKTLVETDPDHIVEIRTQRQQASDENWDVQGKHRVWKCASTASFTTVAKYAQYQAHTFQEALKEEKLTSAHGQQKSTQQLNSTKAPSSVKALTSENLVDTLLATVRTHGSGALKADAKESSSAAKTSQKRTFKLIKFGTNVDLSDEKKWRVQLQELAKMPHFMRIVSASNMLSHVGYKIFGVNTLQMYLKVPGSRTPGHQENNSFCSLNLNVGPGDCEWFGTHEKYWPVIEELCEKNGVDYLTGSWWPNFDELREARVPFYRFIQRPGDLVWVNSGCVHWVQSIGWCNNISWNVGPCVFSQYKSAIERYEWNKLKFYKSIVPMVHLSWNLARNMKITDRRLYEYIRFVLMQSLKQCQLAINYIENCGCELKFQARQNDEPAHYCYDCECEVFNILFVSEQTHNELSGAGASNGGKKQSAHTRHVVHCQACARKRSHLLENFVLLHQYPMDELKKVYDQFQLYVPSLQSAVTSLNLNSVLAVSN